MVLRSVDYEAIGIHSKQIESEKDSTSNVQEKRAGSVSGLHGSNVVTEQSIEVRSRVSTFNDQMVPMTEFQYADACFQGGIFGLELTEASDNDPFGLSTQALEEFLSFHDFRSLS
jgi:hypothetical protein